MTLLACRPMTSPDKSETVNSRIALRTTFWNVWHAKNGHLPVLDGLDSKRALEVQETVEVGFGTSLGILNQARTLVKPRVVVARDDYLDRMRLGLEPVQLHLNVADGTAVGQIAGVDEDIAFRDGDGLVVGIGDAYNPDGGFPPRGVESMAAQKEDNAVEDDGEEGERRGQKVVEEGQRFPLVWAAEAEPGQETHD